MTDTPAPASACHPLRIEARVLDNRPIAAETYRIRLHAPPIAHRIEPGQFVMVRTTQTLDPLLGRPLALWDLAPVDSGQPEAFDLVYQLFGRGTAELACRKPGDLVIIWGPLGNGFGKPPRPNARVLAVAGGIGHTPFVALGRWWLGRACYGAGTAALITQSAASYEMLYGVRSRPYLAGLEDFQTAGIPVQIATDDGSAGFHGRVTDLLTKHLAHAPRPDLIVGCGPKPMLQALALLTEREGIPCLISLENHMACGFGVCFSCVAPLRQTDGSTDLKRVCVEGPVFESRMIVWS